MFKQKTIAEDVQCTGVGVHSGRPVTMTLRPAGPDTGIRFIRTDLPEEPTIAAKYDQVVDNRLATTLADNGASVSTVEHLMAALMGLGVDNLEVEVNGPELPIMDGSAGPFMMMLKSAGLIGQEAPRRAIKINRPIRVQDGDHWIEVRPAKSTSFSCTIEFDHPLLDRQEYTLEMQPRAFDRELSRARTFGFLQDVERLRQAGFARGGSLDNAIVVDRFKILNPDGLRYDDEFVRHKLLDMIGDLALLGRPLIGQIRAHKTGHSLNHRLLQAIVSQPEAWELVTIQPDRETPEPIPARVEGYAEPALA